MRARKIAGALVLLGALLLIGVRLGWLPLADAWNPWAPLDVRAEPNLLTRFKLARLRDNPQLCDQALATSGLRTSRQPDSRADVDCPLSNTVRVQGGDIALSSSFLASCPLAVAFALYQRHGLQPAAQQVFGQRVARVDHLGSFACRNMYHRKTGWRSEHASANALDIAGFRLSDGRNISVLRDWPKDSAEGRFLRLAREGACDAFNVVLGPDFNSAHRNHFHLDLGPLWRCR
ncbi:extensin family protein [Pseudomonas sp. KCJK8993]|uniref:extensin-like domain-containing protein n=1 Tax=Pseudomonas sp. KCJK8993 TaxID=3344565 RepID=UPI0039057D14